VGAEIVYGAVSAFFYIFQPAPWWLCYCGSSSPSTSWTGAWERGPIRRCNRWVLKNLQFKRIFWTGLIGVKILLISFKLSKNGNPVGMSRGSCFKGGQCIDSAKKN
jgi:hypothetical protein